MTQEKLVQVIGSKHYPAIENDWNAN